MSSSWAEQQAENHNFEVEVRRIAALLYPDPDGGAVNYNGKEHDGVFVTDDAAIAVEATVSRQKAKAQKDAQKLKALSGELRKRHPYKAVKGLVVTRDDPTADQRSAVREVGDPVTILSFAAFRGMLINARQYITFRSDYSFGSARDPETNDAKKLSDPYIQTQFLEQAATESLRGLRHVIDLLESGRHVALIGDYGSGKSMTTREVFLETSKSYRAGTSRHFSIHLNLHEHQGQREPAEAILRHCQNIGFPSPHQLVRAWLAGDAHIILDGFDELFMPGLTPESQSLRDFRRRSVGLVKRFIETTPSGSGVLVAGREHYFDGKQDLQDSLGLGRNSVILSTTDFTRDQVAEYLRNREWSSALPEWLPTRPLIIGYLASRRVFTDVPEIAELEMGQGWNRILAELASREARLDFGPDASAVRAIMERLASIARRSSSGLGPLSFADHLTVFQDLMGYLPDAGAYQVLQRLPGLRVDDSQSNTRVFVDDDLVDAARAGDVLRWVRAGNVSQLKADVYRDWANLMDSVGLSVLLDRLNNEGLTVSSIHAPLKRTQSLEGLDGLRAELVRAMLIAGVPITTDCVIENQHIRTIEVISDSSHVTFRSCIVERLDVSDLESASQLPYFSGCDIAEVFGAAGIDDLATERITGTTIGRYSESTKNMTAILALDLPDYTRVALTVLRKVYVQGGDRKESAIYRGPLTQSQRELVPSVLDDLRRAGAIRRTRRRDVTLWSATPSMRPRVVGILEAPTSSRDPLLVKQPAPGRP